MRYGERVCIKPARTVDIARAGSPGGDLTASWINIGGLRNGSGGNVFEVRKYRADNNVNTVGYTGRVFLSVPGWVVAVCFVWRPLSCVSSHFELNTKTTAEDEESQ